METHNSPSAFEFDIFRLDLENQHLLINGRPSPISRKTFQALHILVQNCGHVVTKNEFFAKMWSDSFVEETNLTQHIYVLRKALSVSTNGAHFIETIPRSGYRFNCEVRELSIEPNRTDLHDRTDQEDHDWRRDDLTLSPRRASVNLSTSTTEPQERDILRYRTDDIDSPLNKKSVNLGRRVASLNRGFRGRVFAALFVAGLLVSASAFYLLRSKAESTLHDGKTIAVLPFRSIGNQSETEKLGLGMADSIIVNLSKLRTIPVRPTSSIFRYADQNNLETSAIGRDLDVDTVLEGTVQRESSRVRVSVQLINVADGKPIWAESFDEDLVSIFDVQDLISTKVARSLSIDAGRREEQIFARNTTTNVEAYQAYLLGVYFWNTRTRDGLQKSISNLQRAIQLDPNYARAYACLADAYMMQSAYRYVSGKDIHEKAKESALRALELDESVAQAYVALANIQIVLEKNLPDGRRSLERAIELSPYNATARLRYSWVLLRGRQLDDAVKEMRLAQEYDPLSAVNNAALCGVLVFNRSYDEAISYCNRASELNPSAPTIAHSRANAYFFKGEKERAISELEAFTKDRPNALPEVGALGYFYAKSGNARMANDQLNILLAGVKETPQLYNDLAVISYSLGRREDAFVFLEKSIDSGSLTNLASFDPTFDEFRADPGYESLLKKKNFKDIADRP